MSKIDLKKYFEDPLVYTFENQEFKVDESYKTYQLCQSTIKELADKNELDDKATTDTIFKYAFGEKYEDFTKIDFPAKAYNDIAMEIMATWSGVSKEMIEKQLKIPSQGK